LPEDYSDPDQAKGQSKKAYDRCIENLKLFWCLQAISVHKLKVLKSKFPNELFPIVTCSSEIMNLLIGTTIFNGRDVVLDDGINAALTYEDVDWLFTQPPSFFDSLYASRNSFKATWLGGLQEKLLKVGRYYYALTQAVDLFLIPVDFPYHNPFFNRADESTLGMGMQSGRILNVNNALFRDPVIYFKLKLMMELEEDINPSPVGIATAPTARVNIENFAALNPDCTFNNLQSKIMMVAAHRQPMGW